MSAVNVTSVNILNNPGQFTQPLQFEIQYECNCELQHDLEWRITYVGSAESEEYDQVLDSVLVGPVGPGQYKFVLQTNAPDANRLPKDDIVGVTVILLTCLYQDKEFLRIGYYVNNDYPDEQSRENPPETPELSRLVRSILSDNPRVTRFPIEWDPVDIVPTVGDLQLGGSEQTIAPEQPQGMMEGKAQRQQLGAAQQSFGFGQGMTATPAIGSAGAAMEE